MADPRAWQSTAAEILFRCRFQQQRNQLYEILPTGGYTTVAHSSCVSTGFTFSDGPLKTWPWTATGTYFVSDHNSAVYEVLAAAADTSTVASGLGSGFGFGLPSGLAVDGSGNVFVSDSGNVAVYEILAAGGYATVNQLT